MDISVGNDSGNNLTANDLNFIKNNTKLNSNSIFDFYKTFLSKYNNGCVNREEFSEILQRLIIADGVNDEKLENEKKIMCEIIFDLCDKDDNGFIDFKEYLVLFWSRANGTPRDKLSLIFDMFDLNGNDSIDFHEMHSIVKILFKLKYSQFSEETVKSQQQNMSTEANIELLMLADAAPEGPTQMDGSFILNSTLPPTYHIAMNIMKKFDKDRNGRISKDEFIRGCMAHANIRKFLTPLKVL